MPYYLARKLPSSFLPKDQPTKWYSYASTGLDKPLGLLKVEASRFQDDRRKKVVRLSALCVGRLETLSPPPPGDIAGTNFC